MPGAVAGATLMARELMGEETEEEQDGEGASPSGDRPARTSPSGV